MRFSIFLALCVVTSTLAFAGTAAACQTTPLATVGGSSPPATGVYLTQNCNYGGAGESYVGASAQTGAMAPYCPMPPIVVQPVYVGGQQVPGTGTVYGPYCAPYVPPVNTGHIQQSTGIVPFVGVLACVPVSYTVGCSGPGVAFTPTAILWTLCDVPPTEVDRTVTIYTIASVRVHCTYVP